MDRTVFHYDQLTEIAGGMTMNEKAIRDRILLGRKGTFDREGVYLSVI